MTGLRSFNDCTSKTVVQSSEGLINPAELRLLVFLQKFVCAACCCWTAP